MKTEAMTEDDLHAYVDNALTPAQRARVEAHLATCPEDALRVRAWSAQKQDLKSLFAPVLDEPLPDALHVLTVQPLASAVNPEKRPKCKKPAHLTAGGLMKGLGKPAVNAAVLSIPSGKHRPRGQPDGLRG